MFLTLISISSEHVKLSLIHYQKAYILLNFKYVLNCGVGRHGAPIRVIEINCNRTSAAIRFTEQTK